MVENDSGLKELYETAKQKILADPRTWATLIARKLKEAGVKLSEAQIDELSLVLKDRGGESSGIVLPLTEEQETLIRNSGYLGVDQTLKLEQADAELLLKEVDVALSDSVPEVLELTGERLLSDWRNQTEAVLRKERQERVLFEASLLETWGHPLELLEVLISVCLEEGRRFNDAYRATATPDNDFTFLALTRLHARGCQVAAEVLALLEKGFADGAMARWRTLHEIAVVATFLKHNDQQIAERYLEHSDIVTFGEARAYQSCCEVLGYAPLEDQELRFLKDRCDTLIEKYGKDFARDYGWASAVLRDTTFAGLEREVGLSHWRSFYKLANLNIHAGSKGLLYRLGSSPYNETILVGASVYGLADPGLNTAISLFQLTVALLLSKPTLGRVAFCKAIHALVNDIEQGFIAVHRSLVPEE